MNKLLEGIKTKGKRVEIPNATRKDLPKMFKELGFKTGAEIGVYQGDFSRHLATFGGQLYSIDPWQAYTDYHDPNYKKFQDRQDELYAIAQESLKIYPNCTIIRKTSMEAVKDFEDGSLDFVYIDGHHGFKYVAEDLWEWSKKVRKGGVIAGHDYARGVKGPRDPYTLHVKYVVDAFTEAFKIKDWYVIGRGEKVEGEKRDMWRSFFWFNE